MDRIKARQEAISPIWLHFSCIIPPSASACLFTSSNILPLASVSIASRLLNGRWMTSAMASVFCCPRGMFIKKVFICFLISGFQVLFSRVRIKRIIPFVILFNVPTRCSLSELFPILLFEYLPRYQERIGRGRKAAIGYHLDDHLDHFFSRGPAVERALHVCFQLW